MDELELGIYYEVSFSLRQRGAGSLNPAVHDNRDVRVADFTLALQKLPEAQRVMRAFLDAALKETPSDG